MPSQHSQRNKAEFISEQVPYTWRPLALLNLFRALIAAAFVAMYLSDTIYPPLASHNPQLFFITSSTYLVSALLFWIIMRMRRIAFTHQVHLQIMTDIVLLTSMMHASGGINSGLGNLIIIFIAGGSIVIRGRHALLFASMATLVILYEQVYGNLEGVHHESDTLRAGLLGLTFFTTAVISRLVANYIRESEAIAQKRGVDLANMAQLTRHIIERMQTGIVVIDPEQRIHLVNESAWMMLGKPSLLNNPLLRTISSPLYNAYQEWLADSEREPAKIQLADTHPNLVPRFARLGQGETPPTLIYLEDVSAMAREAQQMQLASLGRLTASIAHEIRNPLGALSHASQLLAESPQLDKHDHRLTQIITEHSQRINTIIESILNLGRGKQSTPELFALKDFMASFLHDFQLTHVLDKEAVRFNIQSDELQIRFDRTHLQQILTNLCENGLRHSHDADNPKLEIYAGLLEETQRPYLDITDHGHGIDPETARHLFEPFYTTRETGTGLGLFISRELAECNQAHLNYQPGENNLTCFRLTFQDPRRQMH